MSATFRALPMLALAACGTPRSDAPAPAAATPPEASDAVDWDLGVRSIRFDAASKTLFVEAGLEAEPLPERTEPVYVGVTAVTDTGDEIDMMVQTLFPGALDSPVLFSAEMPADVRSVLIGAWDRKIEPCDVDRHGCKAFGFVLDGSLATWPEGLYVDGLRQRIPPERMRLAVLGAHPAIEAVRSAAALRVESELGMFDLEVEATTGAAPAGVAGPVVRYTDAGDALVAREVAEEVGAAIGGAVAVERVDAASADIEVVVP